MDGSQNDQWSKNVLDKTGTTVYIIKVNTNNGANMVGRLVIRKSKGAHKRFGVGVVLDYKSVGRFYPSTELKVHWPKTGSRIWWDIELVEFLDENR